MASPSLVPKVHYTSGKDSREEFKTLFNGPLSKIRDRNVGIRVFYFNEAMWENSRTCDHMHSECYSEEWRRKLEDGEAVEAGTTVDIADYNVRKTTANEKEQHFMAVIQWDCGVVKSYTEVEFGYIRVFDLGPTGYKGEMVFCDKCLSPVMGFGWRLVAREERGDLYDLCCTHYNENQDPYSEDQFYVNIPTGQITRESDTHNLLEKRSLSRKFDLIGLFEGAEVADLSDKREFEDGRIFKIEHEDKQKEELRGGKLKKFQAQQDLRHAVHYNCCAEVIIDSDNPLVYRSVGAEGRVDIKVTKEPGIWGSVYASHHPPLCFELLCEMVTYEEKLLVRFGEYNGFGRRKNRKIWDITICGTELDSFSKIEIDWRDFSDLKSFMAYMNKLSALPDGLSGFRSTLRLVCIQNNQFREIPPVVFSLPNLQHLNMHGNYLCSLPGKFCELKCLERVYLGDNDIVSLPNFFDKLPNLREASFKANHLTRLPLSFSKLSKLENLDISNNAFIKFPEPLLELKLKYLNIKGNKIQRLSPMQEENLEVYESTRSFFQQLEHVQIELNPISKHELLQGERNSTQLLKDEANFQLLSKTVPTRSMRVIVLGDSGAGKTSVVEAFTMQKHVIPTTEKDHRHTVGIDRHYYPVQVGDRVVLLHIWDHAGDDDYAMMNDLFITDNCLVWLVVDLNKYKPASEDDGEVYRQHIGKWLLKVMSHDLSPAVWIVCTHADSQHNCAVDSVAHMDHWTKELCKDKSKNSSSDVNGLYSIKDLQIFCLTNTYSFKGHDKLVEKLKSFSSSPEPSPGFSDSKEALQWVGAIDRLHMCAERKLNENRPPVIFGDSEEFGELEIPGEEFLEYCHDIGEIFLLESPSRKTIVVLNLDWMINLLKKVYHHKFDEDIKRLRRSPECCIRTEMLRDALSNRKNYGIIVESILKELWKCNTESNELFDSIIDLFMKFNLTYRIPSDISTIPSYFFPHLKQGKFPEVDYSKYSGHAHITVVYTFACHMPQFFLQRLALEYWRDKEDEICEKDIFEDGFKTEFDSGVKLHVSRTSTGKAKESSEEVKIFAFCESSTSLDDELRRLWSMMPQILKSAHEILTKYWTIRGQNELSVDCPKCVVMNQSPDNNYMRLVGFAKENIFSDYCHNHQLYCKRCGNRSSIHHLVPTPDLYRSLQSAVNLNSDDFMNNEREFSGMLCSEWRVDSFSYPVSETVPTEVDSLPSYSAHHDQFLPSIPCTDTL